MITEKTIKKMSNIFCEETDCDYCPFTEMCTPIWELSKDWMNDGTKAIWKSGFQKFFEMKLEGELEE